MNTPVYYFPKHKKRKITKYCRILSTASYIPERIVSNDDIITVNGFSFKNNFILKSIGVEKRHVAADTQDDSDLLFEAARKCLDNYQLNPENLTRIIVNKFMGDNLLPMTASRLQSKLGSSVANHAFDIDGGISSFLVAMDLASRFVGTGDEYILIASGGIHNRLISKTDPRVAFLFGDASAALLVGPAPEAHLLAGYFYSNHQFYELATMNGMEFFREISWNGDESIFFDAYKLDNWKIAEEFYHRATREIYQNLLDESGLSIQNIDLVLVAENNIRIREIILDTIGVNEDKSISLLKDYGNTMSAMLPLLLDHGRRNGRIQPGMNIMLISHGEGLSGGGIIYKV